MSIYLFPFAPFVNIFHNDYFFHFQVRQSSAISSPFGDFSTTPNPVILSSLSGQNPGVSGGNTSAASMTADADDSRGTIGDSGAADVRNQLDPQFASGEWKFSY